ncbi:MAG: exo-alpha-sialidase [Bacteroidetes bacterium]|nr:MAG: exo-alpha-sialidase [Bacteroidota bacterium]
MLLRGIIWGYCLLGGIVLAQSKFENVRLERPRKAKYDYAQSEPSIAINLNNPDEMVAGSIVNDFYYSLDGGKSWKSKSLKSKYGVWGDPVLLYDKHGAAYYFHLAQYKGVFIDRIVCQRAEQTGKKFTKGSFPRPNGKKAQDKHWVAYDHQRDRLYLTWTQFDHYGSEEPKDSSVILFSASDDQGQSWSEPVRISKWAGDCIDSDGTVEGAYPTVDRKGNLFVVWSKDGGLYLQQSKDGGNTWLSEERKIQELEAGWDLSVEGISRCNGFPVLIADTSGGKHDGRLYLNWSDQRFGKGNTDVFLSYSDDQGQSWSSVKKVHEDRFGREQFFSSMALDQTTGNLYVLYYDRRNYDDLRTDVYCSYSKDGGSSFTDVRISKSPFIPDASVFMGDYTAISASQGRIRPIWPRMDDKKISLWIAIINKID